MHFQFPFPASFRVKNPRGREIFFINSARLKLFCTCEEWFLINNFASTLFEVKRNFFLCADQLFVEAAIFETEFFLLLWVSCVLETKNGGPVHTIPQFSWYGLSSSPTLFASILECVVLSPSTYLLCIYVFYKQKYVKKF